MENKWNCILILVEMNIAKVTQYLIIKFKPRSTIYCQDSSKLQSEIKRKLNCNIYAPNTHIQKVMDFS